VVVLAILFAAPVFEFIFGAGWGIAGTYTAVLSVPYLAKFAILPMGSALTALEKMKAVSIWQIANFLCIAALFFAPFNSIEHFLYWLSGLEIALYCVYLLIVYVHVAKYERGVANP